MNISHPVDLILAASVGFIAGGIFFYGLWITVQRIATAAHPGLLMLASFILRVAVVLGAVFAVGRGHPDRIALCLAGFLVARWIVLHHTRRQALGPAAEEGRNHSCD
jgi:F1F0 ATPase subunit 2